MPTCWPADLPTPSLSLSLLPSLFPCWGSFLVGQALLLYRMMNVLSCFFLFVSSLICQSVYIILPGRQPLHYHVCSVLRVVEPELKQNWTLVVTMAITLTIHIFVNAKIKMLKIKQQHSHDVPTFSDFLKCEDISMMEQQTISDFLTSFLTVIAISIFFVTSFLIKWTNPLEFAKVTIWH